MPCANNMDRDQTSQTMEPGRRTILFHSVLHILQRSD